MEKRREGGTQRSGLGKKVDEAARVKENLFVARFD